MDTDDLGRVMANSCLKFADDVNIMVTVNQEIVQANLNGTCKWITEWETSSNVAKYVHLVCDDATRPLRWVYGNTDRHK